MITNYSENLKNNTIFDVIIIGAGPAGLMAAKSASELGLAVCLIEKKRDFKTLNRACSMQFILDDGYEDEWLKVEEQKLFFQKNHFSVEYLGETVPVKNKYYHSPNNHIIHFALPKEEPFAIKFDKRKLLSDLYEDLKNSDVTVYLNTLATQIEDYEDSTAVEVLNDGERFTLTGKKLILAEGVNAYLSEKVGLNESRTHYATAFTIKYFIENIKDVEPYSWNLYYGRVYHSNTPVIIGPSLESTNIFEVTVTGDNRVKPDEILENVIADSPLTNQMQDIKILKKVGCTTKAFSSLKTPYKGNILAIGDTAAFVEVEVQGALMCGFHAAFAIRDELKDGTGFDNYTSWWKRTFEFNSPDYLKVSQGYALVPTYTDDEIDYLFSLIEDQTLQGTYSQYLTPKLIWDAILSHSAKLQTEAPAIYQKIQNMNKLTLADSLSK